MRKCGLDSLALTVPTKVGKDEPGEEEDKEKVEPEVPVEVRPDPLPFEPEEARYHWVLQQMPEKENLNIRISLSSEYLESVKTKESKIMYLCSLLCPIYQSDSVSGSAATG